MEPLRFLQIEPTTRCNFTCGFCAGRAMPQTDISADTFAATLAAFPALEHVELQGEGESLMHPRFFDMVADARARGVRISFITNGSYLSQPNVDRLLDLGIERVSVSIESADEGMFRQIRGGKLDKVKRGIETLVETRRRRGLDRPSVGFSITVLQKTRGELPALIALYEQLGLDGGVTIQPLERKADYARGYDEDMQKQTLSDEEVGDVWVEFLGDRTIRELQQKKSEVPGFYDELMADWRPGKRSCPWLEAGAFVGNDGRVTPCCMVKDERHALGRIGVDDPDAILARRRALKDQLAAGEIPAPCQGCELAKFSLIGKRELVYWGARGLWQRLFGTLGRRPEDRL
jgi:MoaA/NifB/PqqE/SkfB family radical SAM enzyme